MVTRRKNRGTGRGDRSLPPLLNRLIEAEMRDDEAGCAEVLRAFGQLALVTIPTRGVFIAGGQNDLYRAIEEAARDHLGLAKVREEIRKALDVVAPFDDRDAIETAFNAFRDVSERAYFFAGLAFGVTIAVFGDPSWR